MEFAEAVAALKPLVTQHRAIARLQDLLDLANQVAGQEPAMRARLVEISATIEAAQQRAAAAEAQAAARVEAADADAQKAEQEIAVRIEAARSRASEQVAAIAADAQQKVAAITAEVEAHRQRAAAAALQADQVEVRLRAAQDGLARLKETLA